MLPSIASLRTWLGLALDDASEQGRDVGDLPAELGRAPDSYDALVSLARRLEQAPMRADWSYVEPDALDEILDECDRARETGALAPLDVADLGARAHDAFLARVAGCILGKPFEIAPTLTELRDALEPIGEWPLRGYVTEAGVHRLREQQGQWPELVRERIDHVAPDDDINYTILAMLALEEHGAHFTHEHMRALWLLNLPARAVFGPERTTLTAEMVGWLTGEAPVVLANPGAELCGALIRADAYGYAAMGRPQLAAELAYRDASLTHRATGVYSTMFIAAAIACAPFVEDVFATALRYVPQRSRFAERVRECLHEVATATDWMQGYERVHARFGAYGHCRVYQEIGTLINTVRFASSTGEGICLQVMQGNDTDSFGATAGSILGARLGPIEPRWLEPFNDDIHTALAMFHERSLSAVAERIRALPSRIQAGL